MNAFKTKLMLALLAAGFALNGGVALAADAPADHKAPQGGAPETWPASEEPETILPGECADFSDPDFRLIEQAEENDKNAEEPPKKKKSRIRLESSSCVV